FDAVKVGASISLSLARTLYSSAYPLLASSIGEVCQQSELASVTSFFVSIPPHLFLNSLQKIIASLLLYCLC
ncbi:hypothetical protein, partial [Yersinia enterocolitica]|uniref:hypothetical protein n=1 Tax=Yersinia enterocolitica TaxID=630 RepID=UPI001E2B4364